MAICPTCKQQIKETVIEGRKLIAQINTGPQAGRGRFLTILELHCSCGARIERRYENRIMQESLAK